MAAGGVSLDGDGAVGDRIAKYEPTAPSKTNKNAAAMAIGH
jgi:hypothetical protein